MAASYSSEFGKTLTSGISTLVKGKEKYYILEHLVGSQYHQSGEKQEIMLDEIILGRDKDCHVRFDENFTTVSRHHASIVKDGDNWRLNQLSQKNTTFLNGKAIQDSWYLQSGDEIQLAVNGPKLIFEIPTETTEFKFTQRLSSFKEQVIRPYQTAFIIVCCVVVLIIVGIITASVVIANQNKALTEQNKEQREQIVSLCEQLAITNDQLIQTTLLADSTQQAALQLQAEELKLRSDLLKEQAKRSKTQNELREVQNQMKNLRQEMDNFYNDIINGEKQ